MNIETLMGMGLGGALILIGLVIGRFTNPRYHKSERPPTAHCSCSHGLGQHSKTTGKCNGQLFRRGMRAENGVYLGDQWVKCTCLHYDGPTPIEQYFATQTLPPTE